MQHVVKYLLAIVVLMAGFYLARRFQQRPAVDNGDEEIVSAAMSPRVALEPTSSDGSTRSRVAVAVLADVDRLPSENPVQSARDLAAERPEQLVEPYIPEEPAVEKQPTIKKAGNRKRRVRPKPEDNGQDVGNTYSAEKHDSPPRTSKVTPPSLANRYHTRLDPLDDRVTDEEATDRDSETGESTAGESPDDPTTIDDLFSDLDDEMREDSADLDSERVGSDLPLRHRIIAGDTLGKLAEVYLGDRSRFLDVYEANRDVLTDPRLLPIGVDLSIPRD